MLQKNALLPGQQPPWAFVETHSLTRWRLPSSPIMDPFDTLPVKMPPKSRELYNYCMRMEIRQQYATDISRQSTKPGQHLQRLRETRKMTGGFC